jgi:hypothetical protein
MAASEEQPLELSESGQELTVVALTPGDFGRLRTGDRVTLARDGRVTIARTGGSGRADSASSRPD